MGEVKNQHYISQMILEKFSNEKNQVVESMVKERKIYVTNFRQSMSEKYLYEHPELKKNSLEKLFGDIESSFKPEIEEVLKLIHNLEENEVEISTVFNKVKCLMREFIIFYYRSGALIHEYEFSFSNEGSNPYQKIYTLLEYIMNSRYLKGLSDTIINHYNFSIIKSEKKSFLLSDQYISTASLNVKGLFLNKSNRHIGMKDVIILIPISCEFYVVFSNGKTPNYIKSNQINELSEVQVSEINDVIINNSYVKCIGLNKESVEIAIKNFKFHSPVGTIGIFKNGKSSGATIKKEVFYYREDRELWDFLIRICTWIF